jgi:hypothetical protein
LGKWLSPERVLLGSPYAPPHQDHVEADIGWTCLFTSNLTKGLPLNTINRTLTEFCLNRAAVILNALPTPSYFRKVLEENCTY